MKILKIDDVAYNLPTSYVDITLGDYETWFDFDCLDVRSKVKLISLITQIPFNILMDLPSSLYTFIVNTVSFCFKDGFDGVPPKNSIVIDGISYSISYKDELTLAEWVDIEAVYGQQENRLSEILAIVCRPLGEKYNMKNNEDRIRMFKALTLEQVFPLYAFFLALNNQYQKITKYCSMGLEAAVNEVQQLESYLKNGDGITPLPLYQRMILTRLTRHLKKQLLKCSTSFVTR